MQQIRRLHPYTDQTALITDRVVGITEVANQCIVAKGCFRCVLAGGETPRRLYQQLPSIATDWSRWVIYFGDERCLPTTDSGRNDNMAAAAWLDHVAIPRTQIYRFRAELGPAPAADDYANTLKNIGDFDLVLLGIGEDGHTASLFPYMQQTLYDDVVTTAVYAAPKPPPQRVSLSARRLSATDRLWFLVCGENKREALSHWLTERPLPALTVTPSGGVDIYTDILLP
ncbi:MAG: 6-phosphogluconolactonase [Spongiibacteraceae bacterium]